MCRIVEFTIDTRTGKRVSVQADGFQKGKVADEALKALEALLGEATIIEEVQEYHKPAVVTTEFQK